MEENFATLTGWIIIAIILAVLWKKLKRWIRRIVKIECDY